ncbi:MULTISPECIES: ABC transporter permease [Prauserella]|uniref:ABC transporter permease n=1 Tax=Prauserella TaxID=142577 RepID=UPI001E5AC36D|nr:MULTISPECIES: ABC transporter permease [Prauserella]
MSSTVNLGAAAVARPRRAGLARRLLRNPSVVIGGLVVLLLVAGAALAPLVAVAPDAVDATAAGQGPSAAHPFGTDPLGRDLFSRILHGARVSLFAGLIAVALSALIGIPVGAVAAYAQSRLVRGGILRVVDALQAFPFLILALAAAAVLGPGTVNAAVAIGIAFVPHFVRIARAQVLSQLGMEYVEAARVLRLPSGRIVIRHILPNAVSPLLVQASLACGVAIVTEAGLSFLGLGTQPPTPSWGAELRAAQGYLLTDINYAFWPGLAISLAVLGFNLLGDGLRDVFDPRRRSA